MLGVNFDECRKNFEEWDSRDLMVVQGIITQILMSREVQKHLLLRDFKAMREKDAKKTRRKGKR